MLGHMGDGGVSKRREIGADGGLDGGLWCVLYRQKLLQNFCESCGYVVQKNERKVALTCNESLAKANPQHTTLNLPTPSPILSALISQISNKMLAAATCASLSLLAWRRWPLRHPIALLLRT